MEATKVQEERSVLRVVLPGTSFPLVRQGAKDAAIAAKRPLRSGDYEIVSENQIAAFTPAEWSALPEVTKAKFGYISQSDVKEAALSEKQKPIDEWNARCAEKHEQIAKFEAEAKATETRNAQTLVAMRNDLGFYEGEVLRVTAEKAQLEAKIQAEIDGRKPASALGQVTAAIPVETGTQKEAPMKRFSFLAVLALLAAWPAFAQTDTPTPTNTPTNTPVIVATPTALATLTPVPKAIAQILPPMTQANGGMVVTGGDVRIEAHTSGDRGQSDEFIGAIRAVFVGFGTMTNGTTETTLYTDDTPSGEWAAIGSSPVVDSTDTTIYKVGTASLKLAFAATAVAGNGSQNDITNDDLDADEHIGFWINPSESLAGGDLALVTDDTTDDTYYSIPAVPPNRWTWVDLDISDLVTTRGDVTDKIRIELTSQGATNHAAFNVNFDAMYKWDAADEEALGVDLPDDGLRSIIIIPTAAGTANTPVVKVLYTDYFVAYRTGNDSIVTITDQSANSGFAFVPFK